MKQIILLIILFTASFRLIAEEESTHHFGLKVSPNLAWLRSDTPGYNSNGSKFGFTYGLITEFNFGKRYAFVTGLDVTYRGGKFKEETSSGDTTFVTESSYSLEYIEIPINLKFKTNEIGYLTYYLQAGVTPGFNIRARRDFESTAQLQSTKATSKTSGENIDYQPHINNLNVSMVIGGGIEYTLSGSTVILLGLQFNNGFIDVFDDAAKVNSNFLALTIGVLF